MNFKKVFTLLSCFLLVSLLTLGVQAGEKKVKIGVTDKEIHIGQWGPQTGPAAPWGAVSRGTAAYFKMLNDNGGLHGRKIVYHMFDDSYNPAKTKAGVKKLQESVGIFAWVGGVGTATGMAVKDYLMERNIPWVSPAAGSSHWTNPPKKYLFSTYPVYQAEAKAICQYAVETMKKKRVAIVYQNDDYGKFGMQGAQETLAKFNLKLVAAVPAEKADMDMRPHVMRLRKARADAVLLWVSPVQAVKIVGIGKAMRFKAQWFTSSTLSDFDMMDDISKGNWDGVIAAAFAQTPDAKIELMKKYRAAHKKYAAKDERWSVFYYAGMGLAEPLVEAIKRVGKELTREKVVKELEGFKDFQGIMGKISFKPYNPKDPSCRQGQKHIFLVQYKDNKFVKLTDWVAP